MSCTDWAKNEINLACKLERGDNPEDTFDYGCSCYESAYKAYQSLMSDGHTGMSIGITRNILNRLIDGKPLTPIEDTPDVWSDVVCETDDYVSYQCKRMSSLFKDVYTDGRIMYHDVNSYYCVNKDDPNGAAWTNGFIRKLLQEKYPITMPYYPSNKAMVIHCTEGLFDPKNGDFDTIGIWYVVKPDGEKDIIERFFKESEDGWDEISKEEYFDRVGTTDDNV